VWLIEVADTKGDKEVELPDLGGPLAAVAGNEALEKKGLLAAVKHIHVLAAENRTACGYVGGVTVTATGIATKSTFRPTTGTNVKVTPRLPSDKQIILDLRVEDSWPRLQTDKAAEKDGAAAEFVQNTLETEVTLSPGRP